MSEREKINYVELPASDLVANKEFFNNAFGWEFEDFGDEYIAFSDQGLDGGFYKAELKSVASTGSALIVFLSENLEATQQKIIDSGGRIVQEIFCFPGGRRFHFSDPCGNEYAVWSKTSP